MDLFLTREEIRRIIHATVGDSTDGLITVQADDQMNAVIDNAATWVAGQCRWLALQRRATLRMDQEQTVVPYADIEKAYWLEQHYSSQYLPLTYGTPADPFNPPDLATADLKYVGAGNIIEVAVWDQDSRRYYPLPKTIIPLSEDQDRWTKNAQEVQRQDAFAGKTPAQISADVASEVSLSKARRAISQVIECRRDGLYPWPIPDKQYVIRVAYTISPSWGYHRQVLGNPQIDCIPSSVDAQAIIYAACEDIFGHQNDDQQTERYEKKKLDRINQLRAAQNTGQRIALDSSCTFDGDRDLPERSIPRWDLRPIYRSSP